MSFYGASNNSIEIISSIKSIFPVSQLVSHSLFLLVRKNRFIKCTWFTLRQRFKGYYGNFVVPFCGRLRVFWPCIDLLLIDPFRFLFVQSSLFCELFCRITSKPISERTTSRTFFSFWLDNQSESFFLRVENWRERKRGKLKKKRKNWFFKNDDFSWISTSINHWSFGSTNQHPACGKPIDRHFMCTWHVTNMSLTVPNLYLGVCSY